jgi:hypothetical protein
VTASLAREVPHGSNLSLGVFKERNNSTFSLFDFDRNVVTPSLAWKY